MAETLRNSSPDMGDVTPEQLDELLYEIESAESDLAAALANCRGPRDRIKKAMKRAEEDYGISRKAFARMREDERVPFEMRQRDDAQYVKMMEWRRRPVGWQANLMPDQEAPPARPMGSVEILRTKNTGKKAGLRGDRADSNPALPGTEEHATWAEGWQEGQAEKVMKELADPPKRGVGRPRKEREASAAEMPA